MLNNNEINSLPDSLILWVDEIKKRTKSDKVYWCDGSDKENKELTDLLTTEGKWIKLNENEYQNCYLYRTPKNDVARVEDRTLICTDNAEEAGPTNRWMKKEKALKMMWKLFNGVMKKRTMYVIPYLMGPENSDFSQVGVEITDSAYVVINMRILTRMGRIAVKEIKNKERYVRALHSTGDLSLENRYICHFPDERLLMSINTEYGGNAVLSKKPHALRIASTIARDEGWLAEHMFLLEVENKKRNKNYYISGALPSASGKTNLAMIKPPANFNDFKARTVGDDISWLFVGKDGELRGINPENGFFGVAYGTGPSSNPNILQSLKKNTVFTNVALNPKNNTPWWEGLSEPPETLYDWTGTEWHPWSKKNAAHKNSRFTTPLKQYPFKSEAYKDPRGVKLSATLFGGRRSSLIPLVYEAKTFEQGILLGAMTRAETTAAQSGSTGVVRSDPMSMLAFCGYNMGDYFKHWFDVAKKVKRPPKVFNVNWFRKDEKGNYIWPGFGENFRVLKWMIDRIDGKVNAVELPIGFIPNIDDLDLKGLVLEKEKLNELFYFDKQGWLKELNEVKIFFKKFGKHIPDELWDEFNKMYKNVNEY
ncbi:MAG: phosphoenolpyruvate carboxykinase (GTP) [Candidatus Parvarchaeota archaeon]|jgi:phosphoenolpyruvate carboxykinase (GTP)|nr:phosphoenolpyruvate carboxykinase (GTP) [Candidatus Parvarchaeota archaeon]